MNKKTLLNKIALGTAQFGSHYGIANQTGQIQKDQAQEILDYAHDHGVEMIDTAYHYGESEEMLGSLLKKNKNFKIVSKLPSRGYFRKQNPFKKFDHFTDQNFPSKSFMREVFFHSLERLKIDRLYGYLMSYYSDTIPKQDLVRQQDTEGFFKLPYSAEDTWSVLEDLKQEGFIEKIGFSLYQPEQLDDLFLKKVPFDIIQLPYSIFDHRFEKYFSLLREMNVEICVRSVFFAGRCFFKPGESSQLFEKIGR